LFRLFKFIASHHTLSNDHQDHPLASKICVWFSEQILLRTLSPLHNNSSEFWGLIDCPAIHLRTWRQGLLKLNQWASVRELRFVVERLKSCQICDALTHRWRSPWFKQACPMTASDFLFQLA
jgi:hypothetical protein